MPGRVTPRSRVWIMNADRSKDYKHPNVAGWPLPGWRVSKHKRGVNTTVERSCYYQYYSPDGVLFRSATAIARQLGANASPPPQSPPRPFRKTRKSPLEAARPNSKRVRLRKAESKEKASFVFRPRCPQWRKGMRKQLGWLRALKGAALVEFHASLHCV